MDPVGETLGVTVSVADTLGVIDPDGETLDVDDDVTD